ncbi:MAG: hypothetical protein QM640_16650 [Niabella sp.]
MKLINIALIITQFAIVLVICIMFFLISRTAPDIKNWHPAKATESVLQAGNDLATNKTQ